MTVAMALPRQSCADGRGDSYGCAATAGVDRVIECSWMIVAGSWCRSSRVVNR